MGSSVQTKSVATDNRQAVTDNALGLSVSSGAKLAYAAPIFDFSTSNYAKNGSKVSTGGIASGEGGGVNINVLDGGAIDKSFDFAAFSLSEVLGAFVNQTRESTQATTNTLGTIGEAISNATTTTQQATETVNQQTETIKKGLIFGGLAVGAWWLFFRGKK